MSLHPHELPLYHGTDNMSACPHVYIGDNNNVWGQVSPMADWYCTNIDMHIFKPCQKSINGHQINDLKLHVEINYKIV